MKGLGIGRIVHFVMPYGQHRPAIVIEVTGESTALLKVFVRTDEMEPLGTRVPVHYCGDPRPGTWHWPEEVL